MDRIFLLNLEKIDKTKFLSILKDEIELTFKGKVEENYTDKREWSLIPLIEKNKIDSYQLIYINDQFWSGSGGMIREWRDKKIYQAGFRGFSNMSSFKRGLGSQSYTHKYNTTYQVKRAKESGCDEIILSFNLHNEKLFRVTRDYHLPKVFGKDVWQDGIEPVEFNGVLQWLLMMSLK